MIPSTSKIEQAEKALINEFDKLHVFSESEVLKRYIELDGLVNSSDFVQKCKEIKSLQYKNSEEYSKEKEFFFHFIRQRILFHILKQLPEIS
jgi:hypothetical protein